MNSLASKIHASFDLISGRPMLTCLAGLARHSKSHWCFQFSSCILCEGGEDVAGVVTPLRGGAQVVLHGIQVVEVGVRLRVHQDGEVEEDGEGQVEVEREESEVKERRSCVKMG